MDVDNLDICGGSGGGAGSSLSGARWNPTKEQIDMLEGLYRQGLRTPSADQINQITNRLRVFGHIEGKNVFYWFQNHKARQRQKLKQDSINYYSRLLHKTSSVFPPCHQNVVCSPFYIPYPENHGMYQQQHPNKVLLPRPLKRKSLAAEQMQEPKFCNKATFINGIDSTTLNHQELNLSEYSRNLDQAAAGFNKNKESCCFNGDHHQTLDLFPLKPSGNLQSTSGSDSAAACTTPLTSGSDLKSAASDQQRLFGFFRQNGH